jgi:hypothetical protein
MTANHFQSNYLARISDDASVVRGGMMMSADLHRAAEVTLKTKLSPGISAWYGEGFTPQEVMEKAIQKSPVLGQYNHFRSTTAGQLRRAGFEITPDPHSSHCTIWIPSRWYENKQQDSWIARLVEIFLSSHDPSTGQATGLTDRIGELIRALAIDPLPMQTLDWRDFESLIAELLRRLGYEITLTRGSKDDGIDIYASRTEPIGQRVLYFVQCKRYKPPNKVGGDAVKALYGNVHARQATSGIVVTSSFFTRGALRFQELVPNHLALNDYNDVSRWIAETTDLC